jgi:repressor LexA
MADRSLSKRQKASLRGPLDQNIVVRIPLVGQIVASEPVPVPGSDFSLFDPEEAIELTRDVVREDAELFALKVKGESMIDAMINDGDIVVMKPQPSPNNGELVAVWLEDKGETTLKRFFLEGDKVRLQPENSTMEPIIIDDPSTVVVQGRVVAVVRQVH